MIRITALTEDSCNSSSDEDEPKITKEAEETIAVSEYMRALKLKNENRDDDAVTLFQELLETQVLFEITKGNKDNKLFYIKYSCFKYLGFIAREKGDKQDALQHLLSASELDDTDVSTMNKLGHLALELKNSNVAMWAFEKCLKQNPNHWSSADGILQLLCLNEQYNEAYGWALMWYEKDKNYKRSLDVILEIRSKFHNFGLEFIENNWNNKFLDTHLKRTNLNSVFPGYSVYEPELILKPNFESLKLKELSWYSIGNLIVQIYDKFDQDVEALGYNFYFDEFLMKPPTAGDKADVEGGLKESTVSAEEDENKDTSDRSNETIDKEVKENSNSLDTTFAVPLVIGEVVSDEKDSKQNELDGKPKSVRRRGSDLSFLEQWGWHNKKYARSRKKSHEKIDPDNTLNGLLRKILAKYFEFNFDNESPFMPSTIHNQKPVQCMTLSKPIEISLDDFQNNTKDTLAKFLCEIRASSIDVITLVLKWTKYIAQFWTEAIPKEIQELYLKIFLFYLQHFDIVTWNLLDDSAFKSAFCMTLFYLELYHDRCSTGAPNGVKNEVNEHWFMLYNHVIFHSGFYGIDNDEEEFFRCQLRLYWVQYSLAKYEYDLQRAVDCLNTVETKIKATKRDNSEYQLEFPNQHMNNRINLSIIRSTKTTLERTINLSNVKNIYLANKFTELIEILKDSIMYGIEQRQPDDPTIKVTTQFEVLLESFWNLECFEDCLIWSERCLKYALDKFLNYSIGGGCSKIEWADCITYILTYIENVIVNESIWIVNCLDKYYARLIQSLVNIVVHQLDSPFDKNNNTLHPINTKMPWAILHHILQREEDLQLAAKSSNTETAATGEMIDNEELEDILPNSVVIFFTAHEYLGARSWCTKHDGQLLLHVLDTVGNRLRTPMFEAYRDVIAEYLEQITYCLYGYPARRARSRHIEEHDAHNVELTWERAMQLFDIYRPDTLPEYNSFKNDSISADMEQLLQRIVNLIPINIDPSGHVEDIQNFIAGTTTELPQPFQQLPYRISCIYYLLADHYFKNRDISKSVKYYLLDLTISPKRFDSWVGLVLSQASKLETKLNSCAVFSMQEFLTQSEETLRCFEQCFKLDDKHVTLWIEYGNFAYILHSFCSRSLKQSSATLSMERFEFIEEKKEQCLKIASNCFNTVEMSTERTELEDSHDEKWLYQYMLGKIAEKRKESPDILLSHYIKSAKYLYENNASYPFKISHSNPQNLSIEALEIYYRITASIVKHIEQHSGLTKGICKLFTRILKEVNASPFALNQAKIDDNSINALKRKISLANEEAAKKVMKSKSIDSPKIASPASQINDECPTSIAPPDPIDVEETASPMEVQPEIELPTETVQSSPNEAVGSPKPQMQSQQLQPNVNTDVVVSQANSPSRRGSQESNATTTTTTGTATTTTTGSDSTSSSSSDTSSSDISSTESESESSDEDGVNANLPVGENDIENIFKICIKNLEECVTRFPEHYKSIYRLANIYLNAPEKLRDLKKCKQLLLGSYTTGLGNQIQGLFVDRKNNNFFNGVWKIPSTEIERPGGFAAHLSKCIIILMEVLRLSSDHKVLLELALQLQRTPDSDKRYIKDTERKELFQQAVSFCTQSFKKLLKEHGTDKRNDEELIQLLVEIYKSHKKCMKHLIQKESLFSSLLVDTYKVYIKGKVAKMPENINMLDLAIKLCQYEIGSKKNLPKNMLPHPDYTGILPPAPLPTKSNLTSSVSAQPTSCGISVVPMSSIMQQSNTTMVPTQAKVASSVTNTNITTTTTITTIANNSASLTTTASSSYIPGLPRPRGRPPGSRNITSVSTSKPASTSLPYNFGKMDPATMSMAAMMGMYSNPSLSLAQYSDPNAVTALLNEFYKLSNMTGISSLLSGMSQSSATAAATSPIFSAPASNSSSILPQLDLKNLISSTAHGSSGNNVSAASKNSTSTVISVGSGQLTITPSTNTNSKSITTKDLLVKQNFASLMLQPDSLMKYSPADVMKSTVSASAANLPTQNIFQDMPGISVTKVKQSSSIPTALPPSTNINLPKALPKSLTITAASPSYTGKPSLVNQYPQVTVQPEYPLLAPSTSKGGGKAKKRQQQQKQSSVPYSRPLGQFPVSAPSHKQSRGNPSSVMPTTPMLSEQDYRNMKEYREQMLVLSQYSELMQSMDPAHSAKLLSQFKDYSKYAKTTQRATSSKQSSKQQSKSSTNTASTSSLSNKGRVSVKQLQILQQHATKGELSSPKPTIPKHLQTFNMPDIPGKHLNYNAMQASPKLAHSPNKMSVLPPPQTITPPGHPQISPTKTLQQILAERQKALNDQARATSASATSSNSDGERYSFKSKVNDNVIILD